MDKLVIIGLGWWALAFFVILILGFCWMCADEEDAHDPADLAGLTSSVLSILLVFYMLVLWWITSDITQVLIASSASHSALMLFLFWYSGQSVFAVLAGVFTACGGLQYILAV